MNPEHESFNAPKDEDSSQEIDEEFESTIALVCDRAQQLFNVKLPRHYAEMIAKEWLETPEEAFERYQAYFKLDNHELQKPLLDVGTSNGAFITYLRETFGNKKAFGVEIDFMKFKPPAEGLITASGLCLPFGDNTFEVVLAKNYMPIFRFYENGQGVSATLAEILRVVKENGYIKFDFPTREDINQAKEHWQLDEEELNRELGLIDDFEHLLDELEERGYIITRDVSDADQQIITIKKPEA
jgi:SAM-dependent methyltransferase